MIGLSDLETADSGIRCHHHRLYRSGARTFIAQYARRNFESPCGLILTYSPLFLADRRYWVVQKHERLGAKLMRELRRSRPDLTMMVGGERLVAEDVGIARYIV